METLYELIILWTNSSIQRPSLSYIIIGKPTLHPFENRIVNMTLTSPNWKTLPMTLDYVWWNVPVPLLWQTTINFLFVVLDFSQITSIKSNSLFFFVKPWKVIIFNSCYTLDVCISLNWNLKSYLISLTSSNSSFIVNVQTFNTDKFLKKERIKEEIFN